MGEPGAGGALGYYGSFFSNVTQLNSSTINTITYNQTDEAHGVSVSGSHIIFAYPGTYNLQFSLQVAKTDSGDDFVEIWLGRNGVYVPESNLQMIELRLGLLLYKP
jgi:hypothetical protein